MKKIIFTVATAVAMLPAIAFADATTTLGNSDSVAVSAAGEMICPVQVTNNRNIAFGRIAPDANGGTVSIAADSAGTVTNSDSLFLFADTRTSGNVTVTSAGGFQVNEALGAVTAGATNPATTVTFVPSLASPANFTPTGTSGACTPTQRYVGGALTVPGAATLTTGAYTWSFAYTATYQ
jgi:Domain of unknown function (DUF4402)